MNGFRYCGREKITEGTIKAILCDEEVRISIDYKKKNITMAGICVGVMGNNFSSKLIHEKIKENLLR